MKKKKTQFVRNNRNMSNKIDLLIEQNNTIIEIMYYLIFETKNKNEINEFLNQFIEEDNINKKTDLFKNEKFVKKYKKFLIEKHLENYSFIKNSMILRNIGLKEINK